MRATALLLAGTLALSGCSLFAEVPSAQRRAVIVSFDGAGEHLIKHMLAQGVMPHLAHLRDTGVMADYSRTNFPSKTAAGHAALWTGAYANTNGITSNHVFVLPLAAHSVLDVMDGFSSEALLAEPIWVTDARAGKRVIVNQGTHLTPMSTYMPGGRFGGPFQGSLTLLDGYAGVRGDEGIDSDARHWQAITSWPNPLPDSKLSCEATEVRVGLTRFTALAYNDPRDPAPGYNTLRLYRDPAASDFVTLKPLAANDRGDGWSDGLPVETQSGPARTYFRLYDLDPLHLSHWMLFHSAPTAIQSNKPEAVDLFYSDPFLASGGFLTWAKGGFGPTMYHGGDGTAENRYLDTVGFFFRQADKRARIFNTNRDDWDVLINYIPFPDEAEHIWYGTVDANSPSYDPAMAPHVWGLFNRVCHMVDGFVGTLEDGMGRDTDLAVASDHGFAGLKWNFAVNVALKRAGLLAVRPDGRIDLSRTKILYPMTDGAFLAVNRKGRRGGIVPDRDVPRVLDAAQAALSSLKTFDGKPLVTEFLRVTPGTEQLGCGGVRGGDMYLDLQPGYIFSPEWVGNALFTPSRPGQGNHIFDPRRPDMHAILFLGGPGVQHGRLIGPVRNEDMAPTMNALLGLPAPANATGRVLTEALEQPRP